MVDRRTGRLLYLYDPRSDLAIGDGEPIRDIASVWDVEVLSAFLGRDDLSDLIRRSLAHFDRLVVGRDGYAIVAPERGSPSIAHNAFLALALARSALPDRAQRLTPLADGIVRQQRDDGSYQVFFGAGPDAGEELYPAEAMLALLEAYRLTGDARYLHSAERGFGHYKRGYYDRGLLDAHLLVFFANWQSQAGRALCAATSRPEVKDLVRAFLFELQDRIIGSGFYDQVARRPEEQACVEVACGLEGLADTYAMAAATRDPRTVDYRRSIASALGFLVEAQRTTNCTDRERGGFGGSLASREQRIDVTGHVASGFIKCVENGITEP
ncbi:D-glucuronyl C5-epimerase family protein [Mycobacterium sp. SMC-2]|uniref:D-glucuronyl C5-epimerase family protein n=1 Tax=Mycobacterium sp. SMC-2 TaxID=2857058 RepID=UPI0021B4428C|nr:D-glucuronyl C5-epimerase family protein [Mycobacterium sp. SMC-2]UXA08315.1 D-glucuronyl C5-epimerase family protein [Mycobacterium sp. SMC-2]